MRLGLVCNDCETEEAGYTTTRLGQRAVEMGHEVWLIGVADFASDPDDTVRAWARAAPETSYGSTEDYLAAVQGENARVERITVDELDVLFLRNDPAADLERPWAQSAGFVFGQRAADRGVVVVNDPYCLANAINKMYFQHFPKEVRPHALISRSVEDIRKFVEEQGGRAVVKPLQGSGGTNVFVVQPSDVGNLNQMIEAISRDGYVIAQEYLPAAAEGDTRLFLMNGLPLVVDGKYAAFRRISAEGDARSNVHVGGKTAKAEMSKEMLEVAEVVRPRLQRDGMFLVGLDIVGNKLLEINVFSPGGLGTAATLEEVDFTAAVIEGLEKKVRA
jgi:Glutathione synthase/Ribosomal protein S6 modification enzyme (glutaminyl transferase)